MFVLSFDNDLVLELTPYLVRELANDWTVFDARVKLMMREHKAEAAVVAQSTKTRLHVIHTWYRAADGSGGGSMSAPRYYSNLTDWPKQ